MAVLSLPENLLLTALQAVSKNCIIAVLTSVGMKCILKSVLVSVTDIVFCDRVKAPRDVRGHVTEKFTTNTQIGTTVLIRALIIIETLTHSCLNSLIEIHFAECRVIR